MPLDALNAAVKLLACAGGPARVLTGGTDLVMQVRSGRTAPTLLVDIKRTPEMRSIAAEDCGWGLAPPFSAWS